MQLFLTRQLPTKTNELEEEIAQIEEWKQYFTRAIKAYMEAENPQQNVYFAKEIHQCIQERNMLSTHRDIRKVRINRLKLEQEGY